MKALQKAKLIGSIVVIAGLGVSLLGNFLQYRDRKKSDAAVEAALLQIEADRQKEEEEQATEPLLLAKETLKELLSSASDLVSLKYYYTNVATLTNYKELFGNKVPFTTDEILFTYEGTVCAGIDLSEVQFEIDNDKKRVDIALPAAEVISHELDTSSFEYYNVKNSVFTSISPEELTVKVDELKAEQEAELQDGDFYTEVAENAQTVIEELLTNAAVTEGYSFHFSSAEPETEPDTTEPTENISETE